jgi:hypothetical protein
MKRYTEDDGKEVHVLKYPTWPEPNEWKHNLATDQESGLHAWHRVAPKKATAPPPAPPPPTATADAPVTRARSRAVMIVVESIDAVLGDAGPLSLTSMSRIYNACVFAALGDEGERFEAGGAHDVIAKRAELLAATPEGADRARLQKLQKFERERADSELMALTAEHELRLAELFKRVGVTR